MSSGTRRHALPLLLCVAVTVAVVSAGATAAPGSTGQTLAGGDRPAGVVTVLNGTPNQVSLDTVAREGYGRASLDVAGAVAVGATRLGERQAVAAVEREFRHTPTGQKRANLTAATLDGIDRRLAALTARQGTLLRRYSDGELSTRTFLRRLSVLDAAADRERALLQELPRVVDRAGPSPSVETRARIARLRGRLPALPAPVTEGVQAAVRGTGPARTVYVQAAPGGLVLATATAGSHRRQATVRAAYAPGQVRALNVTEAYNRVGDLYPWIFATALGSPSLSGFGNSSVFLVEASHRQGELRAFLDVSTDDVFHELQTTDPAAVPVTARQTATDDGLRVRVNATHETGPLTVRVTESTAGTGAGGPVDATVLVDGTPVGATGADGRLVAVQPSSGFDVTARTAAGNVTATVPGV